MNPNVRSAGDETDLIEPMSITSPQVESKASPIRESSSAKVHNRASEAGGGFWLPAASLWWREIVRFYRQKSRVIGILGSPIVFWLLIGSGFGASFRQSGVTEGRGYLEYFFPGTLSLIILFSSIFCMMSVIEDRREGFLLSVLASPIPRGSLVMGKILGGSTLSLLQGIICLVLAPLLGIKLGVVALLMVTLVLFLISFGLTSLGFLIAWRLDSTSGFHALVNLFLIPMWLLSGALFPISGASSWVGLLMRANPLTYSMSALRQSLYWDAPASHAEPFGLTAALVVSGAFGLVMYLLATFLASRTSTRGQG